MKDNYDKQLLHSDIYYVLKDALSGDESALQNPIFTSLGMANVLKAIEWLQNNPELDSNYKQLLATDGWRLQYKTKPATPAEFIDYKFIGGQAETVWAPLYKTFVDFLDPLAPFRDLILSTSIGWGKDLPVSSELKVLAGKETIIKKNGDISKGDLVIAPDGIKATVLDIQETGFKPVYKIKLSNGKSIRTGYGHLSTVCFRKNYDGKKAWDTITTHYMLDHINEYNFEMPTEDTFSFNDLDFFQRMQALPCHEYEPADLIDPITERDPNKVYVDNIEFDGAEECRCLQLDYPLGLYTTAEGVYTHNSTLSILVQMYLIYLFSNLRCPWKTFGHSQPMDAHIKMEDGSLKEMKDIKVGDLLWSADGKENKVLELHPQGKKQTVELTFNNGSVVKCSMDHLWLVFNTAWINDRKEPMYKVVKTKDLLSNIENNAYLIPDPVDLVKDFNEVVKATVCLPPME